MASNEYDKIRELESKNFKLKNAFERMYGIVANTVYGAKKVVQLGIVAAAWYLYGQVTGVSTLGALILVELLDAGYEKMLELKADIAKED